MIFRWSIIFTLLVRVSLAQSLSTSNLPILSIDTRGKTIVNEPKIPTKISLFDRGPGALNQISASPTLKIWAGVEFRGSTSQEDFYFLPGLIKKPYGVEIWTDSTGRFSTDTSLVQMPAESDWVLNASYNDRTFMRDVLAHYVGIRMGLLGSRTRYVELVINDVYQGVYILMEKIKKGKNRVPISDLRPTENTGDNLTGGYLMKIDKTTGSPSKNWSSNFGSGLSSKKSIIQVEYPKYDSLSNSQYTYIKNYMDTFEKSLHDDSPSNPKSTYKSMMNLPSFVNYFLLNEAVRNVDGYLLSTYFYKDKDSKGGKLTMGPVWDFNIAFGNADYAEGWKPQGWAFTARETTAGATDAFQVPFWWGKLLTDSSFVNLASKRWKDMRKSFLTADRIHAYIDSTQNVLKEPLARNFTKFPLFGKKLWPNYYVAPSLTEDVIWLKNWISQRLIWLDSQLNQLNVLVLGTEKESPTLNLYPNPSSASVTVLCTLPEDGLVEVELVDLLGRSLYSRQYPGLRKTLFQQSLDLQQFAVGTYRVLLRQQGRVLFQGTCIKQN